MEHKKNKWLDMMKELSVLLLGSEVCNNCRVTAGWHPRQINLPTSFHEKNIAAILSANTRSVCCLWWRCNVMHTKC